MKQPDLSGHIRLHCNTSMNTITVTDSQHSLSDSGGGKGSTERRFPEIDFPGEVMHFPGNTFTLSGDTAATYARICDI